MRRKDRNAGSIKALIVLALLAANIALAFRHPERSAAESRDPVASTSRIDSFNFAQHEQQPFTADRRDPSTALGMTKLR